MHDELKSRASLPMSRHLLATMQFLLWCRVRCSALSGLISDAAPNPERTSPCLLLFRSEEALEKAEGPFA